MTIDRGQPSVRLGQAGSMPLVGLGTWQMTGARCQAAVRSALEVGYRHIDTAVVLEGYSPFKNSDLRHPVLAEIAARHGVTPTQVVVRWHVDHEVVVIPKSANPERIAANFDVFGFSLTDEELGRIDGLSTTRR
jgi:diketogulonate reductase-like aldo/keto reductase